MQRFAYAAILAALLSACGGGGGGSAPADAPAGNPGTVPAPDPILASAVTFAPAKVSASLETGTTSNFTVSASVVKPADFAGASAVYAYIEDAAGVILPNATIVKISDLQYNAVLQTSPTLAPGSYKGNFKLKLCRDSACASHFPGSPSLLPYEFTVAKVDAPPEPEPAPDGALLFAPAKVSASYETGMSSTVSVAATVRRPADFSGASAVYAYVVDNAGVILPDAQIFKLSDLEYNAVLHTSPSLAPGNYQGNFQIKLCRDSACASQFPGSPSLLPYSFVVSKPAPLPFTAYENAPLGVSLHQGTLSPARVSVDVYAPGLTWSAKSNASWLKVGGGTVTGNASVEAVFDAAGLNQGKYTATLTLTGGDGRKVLLPASLTVLPNVFVADKSGLSFSAINGAPIASQPVQFSFQSGVAGSWTATDDAAWLNVSPAAGVTPASTTVTVNPAVGVLASGKYTAKLSLASPLAGSAVQVPVTLNLIKPTLSASASAITFGGPRGRTFTSKALTLNLNTGANAWPWTLSATPAWASPSVLGGSLGASGASFSFAPDAAQAAVGSTTVMLSAAAKVNGDTVTRPIAVTINKDQRKVLASATGVALTSTPGWSRLSRTLKVSDNFAQNGTWTAQSDKPWLSVTASGSSGGNLILTANPATLPQDTISYATITLGSTDPSISAPEPVKVALWKGALTPSAITKLDLTYSNVIADPIRPLVYAHNNGALIDVYNVYTAQKVGTMTVGAAAFRDMAISQNGDRLYVDDTAHGKLQVMNLSTLSPVASWPATPRSGTQARLTVIRPNGVEILLRSDGTAYLTATGKLLSSGISGGHMSASADGKRVYLQDEGYSPSGMIGFNVDYSAIAGGTLFVTALPYGGEEAPRVPSNGQDVAVSADGGRLYAASSAPYQCSRMSPANLGFISYLTGGDAYPNNVEVGSDGRVYCGIDGYYSDKDIWVYRPDGSLQSSFKVVGYAQGLLSRQMVVSGDGLIVVALTRDPLMAIVPVGP